LLCGCWSGVKMDQWRIVSHKDVHFRLVYRGAAFLAGEVSGVGRRAYCMRWSGMGWGLFAWNYVVKKSTAQTGVTTELKIKTLAVTLFLNDSSIHRILHKDFHYRPYKIQVAQELRDLDKVSRLSFVTSAWTSWVTIMT
jgi:hypothetical protein